MALQHMTFGQRVEAHRDLVRVLLIVAAVAAVFVVMLAATTVLGIQLTAPSYEIAPDPAGLELPF